MSRYGWGHIPAISLQALIFAIFRQDTDLLTKQSTIMPQTQSLILLFSRPRAWSPGSRLAHVHPDREDE